MHRFLIALAFALALSLTAFNERAEAEPMLVSYYGYGDGTAYNYTASGEIFDPWAYTAAHPYLPFGTYLLVCYDRCITVRVTDRGPAAWTGRSLDLSVGAAWAIGLDAEGVAVVEVY